MKIFSLLLACFALTGLYAQHDSLTQPAEPVVTETVTDSTDADTIRVRVTQDLQLRIDTFGPGDTLMITTKSKMPVPVTLNGKRMQEAGDTSAQLTISLYSDLVGLGSNQPNGLVQTEGYWSWKLNVWQENPAYRAIRRDEKQKLRAYKNVKCDSVRYWQDYYGQKEKARKIALKDTNLTEAEKQPYRIDSPGADKKLAVKGVENRYRSQRQYVWAERRALLDRPASKEAWQLGVFRNIVLPVITVSKIDNKDRFRQVIYFDTTYVDTLGAFPDTISTRQRFIHTFDLVRYSNVSISTKVNVLYFYFARPRIGIFCDFYAGIYGTGVSDSTLTKDNFYVYSKALGWNVRAVTQLNKKLNVEAWLMGYYISLMSNDIMQKSGELHFPDNNPANQEINAADRDGTIPTKDKRILTWGTQLVVVPNEKNPSNKIFLRFSFYTNSFFDDNKPVEGNNFMQFQVGYRKSIDLQKLGN